MLLDRFGADSLDWSGHWRRLWEHVRRQPLFVALFALGFVATSVPIWVTPILPQGDIYQHLAIAEIIHNYDAPGSIYPEHFELPDSIKPNLLYYYAVHWMGYLMPLEVASKLVLNAYVILLPLSLLALLTTFQRPRRLALFGFLFVYTGLFRTGFAGYLLSIPLYFFGIAGFYRWCLQPGWRRFGSTGALATLLFFTHAQMYLLYMLTVGYMGLFLWRPGGLRRFVRRLSAPLVSLVVFLPWFLQFFVFWKAEKDVMGLARPSEGFGAFWHTPEELFSHLFMYLQSYFRDSGDEIIMLLIFFLMTVGFILRGHREASPVPGESGEPDMPWTHRYMPELISLLLGISIFVLPVHIKHQAVISTRHIPLFVMSLIPWLGWFRGRRASAVLAVTTIGLVLVQSAYMVRGFLRYERELDGYPALFDEVRPWSRIWKVSGPDLFSRVSHGNVFWHLHYNFMLWKGGITDVQFAQYVTCPIRYKPDAVPPYLEDEPHKSPKWQWYDYFLVQKKEKGRVHGLKRWLKPIAENQGWILYERRDRPFERWYDLDRWSPPVPQKDAADPKKADPKKADPKKADPKKADPKKADPKKADPKKADARAAPGPPTAGDVPGAEPATAPGPAARLAAGRRVPPAPPRLQPHRTPRSKDTLKPLPGPPAPAPAPALAPPLAPPPGTRAAPPGPEPHPARPPLYQDRQRPLLQHAPAKPPPFR
jgi:hypothetical protein